MEVFKTLVQSLICFHAWSISAACLHANHFCLYITRESDRRTAGPHISLYPPPAHPRTENPFTKIVTYNSKQPVN